MGERGRQKRRIREGNMAVEVGAGKCDVAGLEVQGERQNQGM